MAREMKDSGIEWIGEIPILWQCVKLGFLYTFSSGDTLTAQDFVDDGIYDVYGANGKRGKYDSYNVQGKHILIGRVGALCGNIHLVNDDIWVTEHALVSNKLSEIVTDEYAAWLLYSMKLGQYASGTAQPVIAAENIRKLRVPLPSIEEQCLIATYLDAKCARIDSVIDQTRASIEEYKKLKQAVITQAVTKGIRPDRQMKNSGIEWIGEIPEEWNVILSRFVFDRVGDIDHYMPESVDEGNPYVMTGDLKKRVSDIDFDSCKKISNTDYNELSKKIKPNIGDVIFARYATIGTVCYVDIDIDCVISYSCVIIKPNSIKLSGKYLFYYLQSSSFFEDVNQYINSNTQGNVGIEALFKTKIAIPTKEEQIEIADYLEGKLLEIDELIVKKEELLQDLESYKKSLIYEYVTGKKEVPA